MVNEAKQKPPRRYEKMRDSGVAWIGMVPEGWTSFLLGQLVKQVKNKNVLLQERNLLSLSYGKIKRKDIETAEGLVPASYDGYNIIEKGDIVLRLTDLQNDHTSLRVGLATERGIITSAYLTLRPLNSVFPAFLYYALHTFDVRKGFYGMGAGVRQGLKYDEIRQIKVVLPALIEQHTIANFLDKKCSEIDAIIADAKASIEEYKAWKASIIYEAVTKGLDPHAEMKDSGVKWIGKIASNFSVIRLKYLMHDYKAGPFGSSLITDKLNRTGDILVYTPEHIARQSTKTEHDLFLPPDRLSKMSPFLVTTGDIIFPIVGSLGRAMVVTSNMPKGIINQRLAKFSPNKEIVDTNYFMWLFGRSDFYSQYIETRCRGSIIVNLTKSIVSDMPVVLPPDLQTQRRIAKYLQEKSGIIDSLVKEKEALISDLETYKKSLIYEVVTGKREVV